MRKKKFNLMCIYEPYIKLYLKKNCIMSASKSWWKKKHRQWGEELYMVEVKLPSIYICTVQYIGGTLASYTISIFWLCAAVENAFIIINKKYMPWIIIKYSFFFPSLSLSLYLSLAQTHSRSTSERQKVVW